MKLPTGAPAPRKRMGRPKYEATPKDRSAVALMVAAGIEQDVIAGVLRINAKTLRKHYRFEIDTSYARVKSEIAGKLIEKARAGDVHAQIYYLSTHGWSQRVVVADGGSDVVDLTTLSDGELAARLARLRRGSAAARTASG